MPDPGPPVTPTARYPQPRAFPRASAEALPGGLFLLISQPHATPFTVNALGAASLEVQVPWMPKLVLPPGAMLPL